MTHKELRDMVARLLIHVEDLAERIKGFDNELCNHQDTEEILRNENKNLRESSEQLKCYLASEESNVARLRQDLRLLKHGDYPSGEDLLRQKLALVEQQNSELLATVEQLRNKRTHIPVKAARRFLVMRDDIEMEEIPRCPMSKEEAFQTSITKDGIYRLAELCYVPEKEGAS